MPRSAEIKQAQEELDAAVAKLRSLITHKPDSVLVDYVLVMEGRFYDEEEQEDLSVMDLAYQNGNCRMSVSVGLLTLAHDHLMSAPDEEV